MKTEEAETLNTQVKTKEQLKVVLILHTLVHDYTNSISNASVELNWALTGPELI